jgi:hypothetical protein
MTDVLAIQLVAIGLLLVVAALVWAERRRR